MGTSVKEEYENLKRNAIIELTVILLITVIKSILPYSETINLILNIQALLCMVSWLRSRARFSNKVKEEYLRIIAEVLEISLRLRDEQDINKEELKYETNGLLMEFDDLLDFFQQRVPDAGITKELRKRREILNECLEMITEKA